MKQMRQWIKINEVCLLFREAIVQHDVVINNFERELMLKIYYLRSTPITEKLFRIGNISVRACYYYAAI